MPLFRRPAGWRSARPSPPRARPSVEELESRVVPYSASGNLWPHPELITLTFMPDGTLVSSGPNGNVYSDLQAQFDARWSTEEWQNAIVSAAQTWAQYANINFDIVTDNGTASGQGNYQQGDPNMGDIRIGGYQLSNNYLGVGYMPPAANNYSIAGDINLNSHASFNVGTTYDLMTVALHEVGHALGLSHTSVSSGVMYSSYNGVKWALSS